MLHELHIFGPLPAAVMQEALRGLAAEPFCEDSGRFDRFRNSPSQGVQSRHPNSAQSLNPDSAQNCHSDGAQGWNPDVIQSLYPNDEQSWNPVGVQSWNQGGAQNLHSDGAQSFNPNGAQSLHSDSVQSLNPDGAQSWNPVGVQSWNQGGAQNLHSDGAQNFNPDSAQSHHPDGVQSLNPEGMQSLYPNDGQSWNPGGARSWNPVGVQSWRIRGLSGAEDRRRLLEALLVPVREARATALLRVVGSEIRGAAFDLEGTLTELEFVDALAGRLGFGDRMQAQTRASMTGRTRDFGRDYEERMAAVRGIEVAVMEEVIDSMTLADGVDALCRRLHAASIPVAVISGGCNRLGEAVSRKIALRALYVTFWEERDGRFTGRAASPIVDLEGKRRALEDFAHLTSCPLETLAAAGDGANDLEMLSAAGTSLLTHATSLPPWPEILAALL